MRKRFKRLLVAIMTLAIALSGILNAGFNKTTAAVEAVKLTEEKTFEVKPGESSQIILPVKSTDLYIYDPVITIDAGDAPFTFSKPKLFVGNTEVTAIGPTSPSDLVFDVTVLDTAKIGTYTVTVKFTYIHVIDRVETSAQISFKLKITEERIPPQLTVSNVYLSSNTKDSNANLVFTVKNEGEMLAKNVYLKLDYGEGIEEKYTVKNIKLGDIARGETREMNLPIKILPTAATGRKAIKAEFTYKYSDGTAGTFFYDFYINITDVVNAAKSPKLVITDIAYGSNLKPGDEFTLTVKLKNTGEATAQNVAAAVDGSSLSETGIIKNYYMDSIDVDDIAENEQVSVELPLKVSKNSGGGLVPVKLLITYMDSSDTVITLNETVYIDVISTVTDTEKPNLIVSNVKQSPEKPAAGGRVDVSFDIENKSKVDATGLMVSVEGYSESTFIPVNSDPYQYYEKVKAGDKIRVTIPLLISNQIPEGLNNITVKLAYNEAMTPETITIPVKNVQNDADGVSRPVLLITNYSTNTDNLVAGSEFELTFDVYNTNTATAARNIKVTVGFDNTTNVFSLTEGNNTFYIGKLNPEESYTKTLKLKIKSTATTGVYPIYFNLDYEYDGYNPDKTDTGNKEPYIINLPVKENLRPHVDNAYIYSWEGPIYMGSPATLHMEFYNMGRSALNNVIITVEGDFAKADGSMYFMGTVTESGTSYADFDVIPNVVGPATCILRITYEDSNGDTHEYIHEVTTDVMDPASMPFPDYSGEYPGGEVFNPDGLVEKKDILPLWAFILIQCLIFVIFVPVTRKVIISIYRARLLKKEQEKY